MRRTEDLGVRILDHDREVRMVVSPRDVSPGRASLLPEGSQVKDFPDSVQNCCYKKPPLL